MFSILAQHNTSSLELNYSDRTPSTPRSDLSTTSSQAKCNFEDDQQKSKKLTAESYDD
jgi:hypothetical protein